MGKLKAVITYTSALLLLFMLSLSAERVKAGCFEALLICGKLIIPALFPFLVLSAFITKLGLPGIMGRFIAPFACKFYGISPAGASALIMGFLGGYPSGAAYIAAMKNEGMIDCSEGERLIAFCNNSGPAFIIGVMGIGIFGSVKIGLRLYAVHIIAALITGFVFRAKECSNTVPAHRLDETNTAEALVASVKQATATILNVCGFILFFSVIISLAAQIPLGRNAEIPNAVFKGFLELGNGAAALQALGDAPEIQALAAALLGWGGLSVHFQTLSALSTSNIKGSLHLTGRLLSAMIAFILMYFVALA